MLLEATYCSMAYRKKFELSYCLLMSIFFTSSCNYALVNTLCSGDRFTTPVLLNDSKRLTFNEMYFDYTFPEYSGGDYKRGMQDYNEWLMSGSRCFSCLHAGPADTGSVHRWKSRGFLTQEHYSPLPVAAPFTDANTGQVVVESIHVPNVYGASACMCPENEVFVHDLFEHGYMSISADHQLLNTQTRQHTTQTVYIVMQRYWDKVVYSKGNSMFDNSTVMGKKNPCFPCPQNSRSSRGAIVRDIQNTNVSIDSDMFGACSCISGYEYEMNQNSTGGVCIACEVGKYSEQRISPLRSSWTQEDSVGVVEIADRERVFPSIFHPGTRSSTRAFTNEYIKDNRAKSYEFDFSGNIRRTGLGRAGSTLDANVVYQNRGCVHCPPGTTTSEKGAVSIVECHVV